MANEFLTAGQIAAASIVSLDKATVLAQTTWRDAETAFGGKQGDTVTVRVEGVAGDAREFNMDRSAEIVLDDLDETAVDVKLDTYLYKGAKVEDEALTLKIEDFNRQVSLPLVKSVANGIEGRVALRINATSNTVSGSYSDVIGGVLNAEEKLNDNDVPLDERFLVIGSGVRKHLLKSDELLHADKADSDSALRDAIIGDLFGFKVVFSNRISKDSAVAYHRSAFVTVQKALEVPRGATWGEVKSYNGFALREVADYDPRFQEDRVVVSTLLGTAAVEDGGSIKRAVKVNFS